MTASKTGSSWTGYRLSGRAVSTESTRGEAAAAIAAAREVV